SRIVTAAKDEEGEGASPRRDRRAGRGCMTTAGLELERLVDVHIAADGSRFRADALRRRMLAAADLGAVAVASAVVADVGAPASALQILAFSPGWILIAKLCGLYDRDHRSLRHLTVDDLPSILFWALGGSAVVTLVVLSFGRAGPTAGSAVAMWLAL